jgi:hypothetical protein
LASSSNDLHADAPTPRLRDDLVARRVELHRDS